ncbi:MULTISPECIES: AarF/UbiB family protein [unclassified Paenibacillus]|uniref:ABC1 kinase family protein n=1 Tax=unclassified Paenibacillus TaxID=185978 RepID=UPI0024062313|nr:MULTISPECIES: AarF/UbiB family protein [unclassified Paenibacillus]MDF9841281.1 putative unusual protein kinase regulating ubiquinone biosynthesis (AarF/ABC1/UbiB family) [Paenibacillus sp. PastF-2]MDF9847872.1 putative unusual protein kinase regulating ubiquinone biosynthesis (AarF/ABC1/UbiB family) [Paenibacillus sp. PastM-2]MDF9854440.1 putative unusual protein kinase regulating ubiquinone biosynthesis (AarF/ABC1/UbiB family) [Paenibacillus sp. PastF-1]MDH6479951.1 putative unusual protei
MSEFFRLMKDLRFRRTMQMLFKFVWAFWWLGKQKYFIPRRRWEAKTKALYRKQASYFTETAMDMGGLIIKLGQHVSAQVDFLPKEILDELSKLQDSVAPVDFSEIKRKVESELHAPVNELFADFNTTPIAAASLGQVHRATLRTGEQVAVKVMRPGVEDIIEIDSKSIQVAVGLLKRQSRIAALMDLDAVYEEFYDTVMDELDYQKEGRNAEEFQQQLKHRKDIVVPGIYWSYTTSKVLTMAFMEGVKINNFAQLDAWGVDRMKLAKALLEIFVEQILVNGFFHADPHPGNVLVQPDSTIALIDFGMVGRIAKDMKTQMVALLMAVYLKDANGAIDALNRLRFLRRNTDLEVFSRNLTLLFEQINGDTFDLGFVTSGDNVEELRDFLYSQPFQLPANTTFLGKAMITVYGLCLGLDPELDLIGTARPYIQKVVLKDLRGSVFSTVVDEGTSLLKGILPTTKKFISAVDRIDSGNLRVKLSSSFEKKLIETQNKNTRRIIVTIIGAVFLLTASNMWNEVNHIVSYVLGTLGLLIMLSQLITRGNRREERHVRQMNAMRERSRLERPKLK